MPERIDAPYPFYIWDQVLDGNTWRCHRPQDFKARATTFAQYARAEAKIRNLVVDVRIEDENTVVLHARKGDVQPRVEVVA